MKGQFRLPGGDLEYAVVLCCGEPAGSTNLEADCGATAYQRGTILASTRIALHSKGMSAHPARALCACFADTQARVF
jgi:hypothetical protein